jgi:exopolysaccharide biosynthesis polyprenyl glycosylphosphotransferase
MTGVGLELSTGGTVPQLLPLQRRLEENHDAALREAADLAAPSQVDVAPSVHTPEEPAGGRPQGRFASSGRHLEVATLVATDAAAALLLLPLSWHLAALALLSAPVALGVTGLHRRRFSHSVLEELPQLGRGLSLVLAGFAILHVLLGMEPAVTAAAGAVFGLATFAGRSLAYRRIGTLRRAGRVAYPVLLVGHASAGLADRIESRPATGLHVAGAVDARGLVASADGEERSVLDVVDAESVTDVIVDAASVDPHTAAWMRQLLVERDLCVHLVLPQVGTAPRRGWDDHIWGVPLLRMQSPLRWRPTRVLKRATDVVVSGAALLAILPLLAVVAAFVRREVGAGIIFRQERVGLDGHTFDVLKFRSMRNLPPGVTSPWSVKSEDRIGPVGRFIRKYSIDELPQLWNVFRGDMSLVGPRPERPEFVRQFSEEIPHYAARHRVPVGLTGLAAVEGLRGDTSIVERAYFDNLYVDSWGYWTDLKIIARTVVAVVRGTGS